MNPKGPVPLWRWAVWWLILAIALFVFYGLFTPVWIALRGAGWIADKRARMKR